MVNTELMMSLIDDILDNAKIQSNNFILQKSKINISTLFEEIQRTFDIQSVGKGIRLYYQIGSKIDDISDIEFESD